jgi:pSer/pThr/pTyr-binding forkhead associated (FHA) protein
MAAQYQLVMHAGPTPSKIFPLEGEIITIGRETGNNIIINDAEVSRKHTQFVVQDDKVVVTDLGSTNGTFVDGQRLTGPHTLQPGQIVSLGEQINLLFETVIHVDLNATVMSTGRPPVLPMPVTPAPQPTPSPTPVNIGPAPSISGSKNISSPQKAGRSRVILIIILLVLCLLCTCAGTFWYLDTNSLWCKFLPFLFGSSCG